MAFMIGGKEVIIQEVPVLPANAEDAMYIRVDMQDEETQQMWGLYKWGNDLYKSKK